MKYENGIRNLETRNSQLITMLKIAFFGSSHHSLPTLEALKASYEICCIVTQPARPVGRKGVLTPTPVGIYAQEHSIPLLTPKSQTDNPLMYEDEGVFLKELSTYDPNIIIVTYYGQWVPDKALALVEYGGINIHPSLLPAYRGASPGQFAMLSGEKQTGISIIKMAAEIDAGGVLAQAEEPIYPTDLPADLYTRLFQKGAQLLVEVLPKYIKGTIDIIPQPTDSPTPYAKRLAREDGYIPYTMIMTAIEGHQPPSKQYDETPLLQPFKIEPWPEVVERTIRALTPWPGVWTKIKSKDKKEKSKKIDKRLKILKAHIEESRLVIEEVQVEGEKPTSWTNFLAM